MLSGSLNTVIKLIDKSLSRAQISDANKEAIVQPLINSQKLLESVIPATTPKAEENFLFDLHAAPLKQRNMDSLVEEIRLSNELSKTNFQNFVRDMNLAPQISHLLRNLLGFMDNLVNLQLDTISGLNDQAAYQAAIKNDAISMGRVLSNVLIDAPRDDHHNLLQEEISSDYEDLAVLMSQADDNALNSLLDKILEPNFWVEPENMVFQMIPEDSSSKRGRYENTFEQAFPELQAG